MDGARARELIVADSPATGLPPRMTTEPFSAVGPSRHERVRHVRWLGRGDGGCRSLSEERVRIRRPVRGRAGEYGTHGYRFTTAAEPARPRPGAARPSAGSPSAAGHPASGTVRPSSARPRTSSRTGKWLDDAWLVPVTVDQRFQPSSRGRLAASWGPRRHPATVLVASPHGTAQHRRPDPRIPPVGAQESLSCCARPPGTNALETPRLRLLLLVALPSPAPACGPAAGEGAPPRRPAPGLGADVELSGGSESSARPG